MAADQRDVLAALPTREVALSKLMSVMIAPTTNLVLTLNGVPSKLVGLLTAIKEQKQIDA